MFKEYEFKVQKNYKMKENRIPERDLQAYIIEPNQIYKQA